MSSLLRATIIFSVLAIALPIFGRELPPTPPSVEAVRTREAIRIDGELNEAVWRRPGYSTLYELTPNEGTVASKKTEIWVAYDNDAIYVASRMYDSAPDSIFARLTRRDDWADADMIYIAFDPYHDKRTGYFFGLSAAGAYTDGTYQNDEWDDNSWDGIWEGKTRIDSLGWTAEFRIPFSQIRFQNASEQVWGINVNRYIPRCKESDYITYRPADGSCFVSRFVELHGLHDIPSPTRIEILPYAIGKAEYLQHGAGDPFNKGSRYTLGAGADVKMGLGPNVTLDGTVNPDFGQVEIDPAVINLSDQETFFWEKRPFFLEGTNVFRFGNGGGNSFPNFSFFDPMFFNSRRIGRAPQGSLPASYTFADVPSGTRILGAAKVTGELQGDNSFGFVQAVTARDYADIDSAGVRSSREVEPLTSYTAGRIRKEYNDGRQSIGIIATGVVRAFSDDRLRNELSSTGSVLGIDGWTFFDADKSWVLTGYLSGSRLTGTPAAMIATQLNSRHYYGRPDATHIHVDSNVTSLNGYTARFWLNKQKGNVLLNAAFGFQTPGLDMNDLGLSYKADVINGHVEGTYRWTEPGVFARNAHVSLAAFQSVNFEGINTSRGLYSYDAIEFSNYCNANTYAILNLPAYSDTKSRGGPLVYLPTLGSFGLDVSSDERSSYVININPHVNINPNRPWSWGIGTDLTWKVTNSLFIDCGPSYDVLHAFAQYVTTVDDPTATATFGHRYVFASIDQQTLSASLRVNWTFTPDLSLQCYIQPFIATGVYHDFKELAHPRTFDFTTYGQNGGSIKGDGSTYSIDPDGPGPAPVYSISNPNFNYRSFRLNAVLRWEYLPGSTMYLVWTQSRAATELSDGFDIGRDNRLLFSSAPDNILLLKISYWVHG